MNRRSLLKSCLLAIPGVSWLVGKAEAKTPRNRASDTIYRQRQVPCWNVRARQYYRGGPDRHGMIIEIEFGGIMWICVPDNSDGLLSPDRFSDITLYWGKDKRRYDWYLQPLRKMG